jgi:hypothetical protein
LTLPVFFAIIPQFRQARILARTKSVTGKPTKRNAKKASGALLEAFLLFVALAAVSLSTRHGQSRQSSASEKWQAIVTCGSATPASSDALGQGTSEKTSGMMWTNTHVRVYHQQRTRWYAMTKYGQSILEVDAIKAGFKPAK